MIDAHVHLENGPLSKEYAYQFIHAAKEKGIEHLQILDHTHRFFEFADMYSDICSLDADMKSWFEKKQANSLQEYVDLIEEMKKENLPIQVDWGLEVCYEKEREPFLKDKLQQYPFDFLVGSVHSVYHRIYDIAAFSERLVWDAYDAQDIYKNYYKNLADCIQSGLFTQIGHPDVIKLYQIEPGYDLIPTYSQLAELAKKYNVKMEDNTGAYYRYNHPEIGLNPEFRKILQEKKVEIVWASDAHYPDDVGNCYEVLNSYYK